MEYGFGINRFGEKEVMFFQEKIGESEEGSLAGGISRIWPNWRVFTPFFGWPAL